MVNLKNEKLILRALEAGDEKENWIIFLKYFIEFVDKEKFNKISWSTRDKKILKKDKKILTLFDGEKHE